jgi:cytochrome c oxidase accessory protein FixG
VNAPAQHHEIVDDTEGFYHELDHWHVNTGTRTIHAKRIGGRFRSFKTATAWLWLIFFVGPYLRWNGRQAVMFDIPARQFHFFNITVLPQDIWMLSLVLLVLAMTLFAVTSVASRAFCGYFCFQTVWTDAFTWIESRLEGNPGQRHKLDKAPWTARKLALKGTKHAIWVAIGVLTGISFSIWFTDAGEYWSRLAHFQLPPVGWVVLTMFTLGTYILAGFMREQVCFWLCPYARIQGVMSDSQTVLPTYDRQRGEPRGKLRKDITHAADEHGACIDCFQCVQVCPTGVDIRDGQQLGCITCGVCIDACDAVMDKVGRPRGLIRYASLDELAGRKVKKIYQHPRTLVYLSIIVIALGGIAYGLTHLGALVLQVMPERQPLFVRLSDGAIMNKYQIKVLNKTDHDLSVAFEAEGGPANQVLVGAEQPLLTRHGRETSYTIFVRVPETSLRQEITPIEFRIHDIADPNASAEYKTVFNGPKP